ncbi:hypothetical protein EXIGLDRAFT_836574 [Exidia glandulosa HHB12029]|uniref:Uncharacterized protein n=1 Tax=Exidia glandulosa HHB12029 TaxID=1314781 RepID=A0A165HPV2_EXIGL|nr:hypothetical protein EXIGLDRAFT_836574 [Exidia glandulosa HHB12029]
MGNTVSRKGSAVSPPRRRASAADSSSSPALPTPPVTFFLNITPDPALPVELIEHVVTAAWTLPMPWSERVELRTRLHLVNRTWHSVTSRVVLAHLFVVATERAVRRIDAQLSQRPRALLRSLVTYRDFCTSLTLRLPRGRELVRFLRDDAQPFMTSLTHLTHLGLDFTSTPPSPIHNTVEQQAGYTTLSIIFQLMEYAGPISSIVLKLGCPTHPHPEFTFGDLRQQQFPSITRAWLDTDNGPLAVHFLQQCYNVRELRLTCAFYGVVTELSHLLTWLTRLTLVVACHPRVRPPCAHADADSHPLKSWTIPLALKRGLLQPELGGPHGTLILEGADAIALGCEDETSFRRVMQAAAQARVNIEFRPLQEARCCYPSYRADAQPEVSGTLFPAPLPSASIVPSPQSVLTVSRPVVSPSRQLTI